MLSISCKWFQFNGMANVYQVMSIHTCGCFPTYIVRPSTLGYLVIL